jgi:hypothetical protein
VPYMSEEREPYEVILRGFSPRELTAQAERRCTAHFAGERFRVEELTCVPCVCSLGGRVRLYEAHVVARTLPE